MTIVNIVFLLKTFDKVSLYTGTRSPNAKRLRIFRVRRIQTRVPRVRICIQNIGTGRTYRTCLSKGTLADAKGRSLSRGNASCLVVLSVSNSVASRCFLTTGGRIRRLTRGLKPGSGVALVAFKSAIGVRISSDRGTSRVSGVLTLLRTGSGGAGLCQTFSRYLGCMRTRSRGRHRVILIVSSNVRSAKSTNVARRRLRAQLARTDVPMCTFYISATSQRSQSKLKAFTHAAKNRLFMFNPRGTTRM